MGEKSELTSMTVSLPAAQKEYVKARVAATGCSTPSEYIRRLIHADQQAREEEGIERKILEGLDSTSREMSPEEWSKLRNLLRSQLTKLRKAQ
jgi:Arc/MetJ-type ribon-helix-helix transcriptional regulator